MEGREDGWEGEERRFKTLEKELIVFPVKEGYIWTTHNPRRLSHTQTGSHPIRFPLPFSSLSPLFSQASLSAY